MAADVPTPPRRPLHFASLDAVLADFDRLAAADAAGVLTTTGRWSFGQSANHLATWADYCYDGLPLKIPLPLRLIMRLMKRQVLYKPMRAGSTIPRVPGGTLATDVVPAAEAVGHLRRSFTRLRDEAPTQPHLAFGAMTHDEWIALHLRHAELHLSFFHLPT